MARSNYTGIDWSQPTDLLGGRKVNHDPFRPKQAHYKPTLASIRRNPNAKRGDKVTRDLAHPIDILSLYPHSDYENADDETLVQRLLGTTVRDLQAATGNPDATRSSSRSQESVRLLHALLGGVGAPTGTLAQKQAQLAKNEDVKEALAAAAEDAAEADPSMAPLLAEAAAELDTDIDDVTNFIDGNIPENEDEFVNAITSTDAVNDSLVQAKSTQLPDDSVDEDDANSMFHDTAASVLNQARIDKPVARSLDKSFAEVASSPSNPVSPNPKEQAQKKSVEELKNEIKVIQEKIISTGSKNGYSVEFNKAGKYVYKEPSSNVGIGLIKYIRDVGLTEEELKNFNHFTAMRALYLGELKRKKDAEAATAANASSPSKPASKPVEVSPRKTRSKAKK